MIKNELGAHGHFWFFVNLTCQPNIDKLSDLRTSITLQNTKGLNIDIVENVLRPLKTESISKLSNSKIPWTKTLNEDNFHHIAFFFTFFKGYRRIKFVIGNNTKENFLWVPVKTNFKFHKMTSYT